VEVCCIETPLVSFSRSPVSEPWYTLPKPNLTTNLGQNAPAPLDYNDPDPPSTNLSFSQTFKVDPTQSLRE
jgi:hypothetical protein